MSIVQDLRTRAKHRGKTPWQLVQTVGRLEREADEATCRMVEMATDIDELRCGRNQLAAQLDEIALAHQAIVDELTTERDHWRDKALALQARFGPQLAAEANANRITVPPMQRIGADQDTGAIDVTALWDARDNGLLGLVTDPGRITQ